MLLILILRVHVASSLPALPLVSPSVDLGQNVSNALNVYTFLDLLIEGLR